MAQSVLSSTPELSFITSNKNKRLVPINGYIYLQNKSKSKDCYWICQRKMCAASVHLDLQDQFIKFTKAEHNHLPVPEQIEIRKLMTKVKARVNTETTAISQIYHEEPVKANLSKSFFEILFFVIQFFRNFNFSSSCSFEISFFDFNFSIDLFRNFRFRSFYIIPYIHPY